MEERKTKFLNINSLFKKNCLIYAKIIVIVAIIIITFIVVKGGRQKKEQAGQSKNTETPSVTVSKSDNKEELPADFPEIPLNGKKKITDNYTLNYVSSNSSQKVIDFTSSKSLKENIDFYKNWADKNKLRIVIANEENSVFRLLIEKDKKPLSIIITKTADSTSSVNISWRTIIK